MTLDQLARGESARITHIEWDQLAQSEALRLRALGLDEGTEVSLAHRGIFGGADPVALTIGRMTIAVRRAHAAAMQIEAV
jgi:ferrous iron transport protein A